jgi:hypoxanthine phosphoribosyltransferase
MTMHNDIEEVLFTPQQIAERVAQLGDRITADYAGKEICAIGILRGAVVFFADLIRTIERPLIMDFMAVSSYGAGPPRRALCASTRTWMWTSPAAMC